MSAKAFNEHSGVLNILSKMLIEQLVGPVLGEDVMNFLLKPGETKMAPPSDIPPHNKRRGWSSLIFASEQG
jgi:hypothetical protein